jgi:hypothetical protein
MQKIILALFRNFGQAVALQMKLFTKTKAVEKKSHTSKRY